MVRALTLLLLALIAAAALGGEDGLDPRDPSLEALERGKIAVGEAVFATDPQARREHFRSAIAAFETVLELGTESTPDGMVEARDFLAQLHGEIEPNRREDRAVPLRVLVVTCGLDHKTRRLNRDKYRALAYKARDRTDAKEAARIREKSMEDVRIRTAWSTEDRNHLRGSLERASRLFFEWSRGRARLDFRVESLVDRIDDLRVRTGGGRGLWLVGDPADRDGESGPEEILRRTEKLSTRDYDFVLLVPKYERGDEEIPKPTARSEERARFVPVGGVRELAHLAFEARPDGKKTDGAALEQPFAVAVIDRVYGMLRNAIARDLGLGSPGRAIDLSKIDGIDEWMPPLHQPLRVEFREYARGEPFYREVLGGWFTEGMFRAAVRLPGAIRDSRPARGTSEAEDLLDADPRTGVTIPAGTSFRMNLRSAISATELGLLPGSGVDGQIDLRLTVDDGVAVRPLSARVVAKSWRPIRIDLGETLKIRRVSIEFSNETSDAPESVDIREIWFFRP